MTNDAVSTNELPTKHLQLPPPVQMVQMLTGFQVAQALYVAAKLNLATEMLGGPRSTEDLARSVGAHEQSLGRLLRSLASLGVFSQTVDGTYALTPLGATLADGTPGSMRSLALTWMETHYLPFGDLLTTIRTGECAATRYYGRPFFDWLSTDPEQVATFTGAMANLTDGIRSTALADYELPAGEVIADIGGADGRVMELLLNRPGREARRGIVFDLPHVVGAAEAVMAQSGLSDRVRLVAGDFFESVPAADVYVVSMILHDWDDAGCRKILSRMAEACQPGARLCALEFVVPPGDQPHMSKLIDLTMLGMLTGRERTEQEFAYLFASAGFHLDRVVQTPSPLSLLEATRAD